MKAIGYLRVSTEGQATDGVSMDAQRAKIEAWADLNGYGTVEFFEDAGISGTKSNRPGLLAAIEKVGKGDALVVYSLSKLARSTKNTIEIAEKLEKTGADLVSISEKIDTTTAAGKMVFRMLAVLNEFERDQIAERTSTALQYKKSKGELVGAVPYGYSLAADGTHLEENQDEQEIISIAKKLFSAGWNFSAISRELEARGKMARNGKAFFAQQIKRMVA